jgi:CRISPR/Cas system CSM-associated protein Csm4 (group 5 of RAMP superfamily)
LRAYLERIHELEHQVKHLENLDANRNASRFDQQQQLQRNKSAPKYQNYPNDGYQLSGSSMVMMKRKDRDVDERNVEKNEEKYEVFTKFINRFLQMYFIYNSINNEGNVKKQLKCSWKWIKEVVK